MFLFAYTNFSLKLNFHILPIHVSYLKILIYLTLSHLKDNTAQKETSWRGEKKSVTPFENDCCITFHLIVSESCAIHHLKGVWIVFFSIRLYHQQVERAPTDILNFPSVSWIKFLKSKTSHFFSTLLCYILQL